jgi:O-antigen/teichoic acid export membrane protein
MSRSKRFTHSLLSGYALLAVNTLFTLAQFPLALIYLSVREFSLWALVTGLSSSLQLLIDLGMSGSVARILVDHKDDKGSAAYGTIIKTGTLAMLLQGALIAIVGILITLVLPHWMKKIPADLYPIFRYLMIGQCLLLGAAFIGRISTFILQAHQRYDVSNYSQIGGFIANLLILWIGFEMRLGLYSMLLATGANLIFSNFFCLIAVINLKLFPAPGRWGRADWQKFKDIFSYANDIFLLSFGQALMAMSQTFLMTELISLEANAVWNAMTKTFVLAQQLITRTFDFSATAFAEMMVRGEPDRLRARFRDVIALTGSFGVFVCLGVALCNRSFVQIWVNGKFSWPLANDWLMALFILINTSTRCHIGLAGITKQIGVMKYIFLIETAVFITLVCVLATPLSLAGIILSAITANVLCSGLYGLHRTTDYFSISPREVLLNWFKSPAQLLILLSIVAAALLLCTHKLGWMVQLIVNAVSFGALGLVLLWGVGFPNHLRSEMLARFKQKNKE